jgi:tetratricopeptide (TPR) repeat protein
MKSLLLTFLSLAVLCVPSLQAQERAPAVPPADSASPAAIPSQSTNVVRMSERQVQEMRADILMARKMYPEAIQFYDQLLAQAPKDAELMNKIGVAYQQQGNSLAAGHYYKRAMKANKTYVSAINNLGTVEYEKKHYGRAIRLYKQALVLKPTDDIATLYSNLGYAYFGIKEYPEAMKAFQEALARDPDIFAHHGSYGTTVQQRGTTEPGLFYFLVAKTFAKAGDAEHCAHYLKMARDEGFKDLLSAQKDPEFAKVIKDTRVQEAIMVPPSYAGDQKKSEPPPQQQP